MKTNMYAYTDVESSISNKGTLCAHEETLLNQNLKKEQIFLPKKFLYVLKDIAFPIERSFQEIVPYQVFPSCHHFSGVSFGGRSRYEGVSV